MLNKTVLITGASRGLGLEIVKQLSKRSEKVASVKILATCRSPETAQELQSISSDNKSIIVKKLDVNNFSSYTQFTDDIKSIVETEGISCLINNAGISPKSSKYNFVTSEQMAQTFATNTIAPLLFSRAMIPFLKTAASKNENGSLIVNMSSILGSIELNHPSSGNGSGGVYPYRASKSALNMITRSLSLDLSHINVKVVAIHPGWVKTEMGGKNAPLTPEESITNVLDVIQTFNAEQYNGCLINYMGQKLPF